jgi:SAP domain
MEPKFESMTVTDLKKELSSRELSVSGKKADLVARLNEPITWLYFMKKEAS